MAVRQDQGEGTSARVIRPDAGAPVVLVCEHATHEIPPEYDGLGLAEPARTSHAAWDPGAMAVAERLARRLDAVLVAGVVSRLVVDLNRAADAPDAMPAQSEVIAVPGNADLGEGDRAARIARHHDPFHATLARCLADRPDAAMVTVHSFTPVYHGHRRDVEIGVLHHRDARLADAMLTTAANHTDAVVRRNAPYGPQHNVMYTLERHGSPDQRLHAMLEIRNDLIASADSQRHMADMLAGWIADACTNLGMRGVRCDG